jgi:hypothetical protein
MPMWYGDHMDDEKNGHTIEIPTAPAPAERDAKSGRFLPGNSGFGGRPRGARSKLGEAFTSDLLADWKQHGLEAIKQARLVDPVAYVSVVGRLLPKEIDISLSGGFDHCNTIEEVVQAVLDGSDLRELLETLDLLRGRVIEKLGDQAIAVSESTSSERNS